MHTLNSSSKHFELSRRESAISVHELQTTRPKLTDEQKAQLKTCFELMDADGSGAIDADELMDAFVLLGLNFSRAEIQVCLPTMHLRPEVRLASLQML